VHRGDCPADGRDHVVVTGGDVRDNGAEEVERCIVGEFLDLLDVAGDLGEGDMARALDHPLDTRLECPAGQSPECQVLGSLRMPLGILEAAWPHAVPEARHDPVLGEYLEEVVEFCVEGVFLVPLDHHGHVERSAPRHDGHDPGVGPEGGKGVPVDTAVKGQEVDAVPAMLPDHGEEQVCIEVGRAPRASYSLVYRDGPDRGHRGRGASGG